MKRLLVSILVVLSLAMFSMAVAAAEKAGKSEGSQSEKAAILHAVAKQCPPDWCKPEIQKIIGSYATVLLRCKKKDCENDVAYLMKVGEKWVIKEQGTGIEREDLRKDGFPRRIAEKLCGWE